MKRSLLLALPVLAALALGGCESAPEKPAAPDASPNSIGKKWSNRSKGTISI